jgi:hypothetical protein
MPISILYKPIETRKLRYSGEALAAFKASDSKDTHICSHCNLSITDVENTNGHTKTNQVCSGRGYEHQILLQPAKNTGRNIGKYPLTSSLSSWATKVMDDYQPDGEVTGFVAPFSAQLCAAVNKERQSNTGLHDLNLEEFTYQVTLQVGAAILLAADSTAEPIEIHEEFSSSKASNDDHFSPWGRLLTGLECDPPIIAMFPVYLMMCKAFTFEPDSVQADYVYSALTGVDWAKGENIFSDRLTAFEKLARSSVPHLKDVESGQDRSYWRIAHAYLGAMNGCENARPLKAPRKAPINHQLSHDLVIAARGFDTIGSAYMCSDGASWLDDAGIDSLVGSALPNDVMDLHTDIWTGETRNTIRLIYPEGLTITQAMRSLSTMLSAQLCELFRGHQRARFNQREEGRIAATSPPYSFCRARHRRIFEVLELYINKYPEFWDWTWEIYRMAKEQVTEAGVKEPLRCALARSTKQEDLPPSPRTAFYDVYYDMVEEGSAQLEKKNPLGVSEGLAQVTRDIYNLWHVKLLADKDPGWGRRFDVESDRLFGEAGELLSQDGNGVDNMYKFAIAYGRLSMALPYIAYHTVDAIILAFGVI